MKTALPWLLVVILVGSFFVVFQRTQRKNSELLDLTKQVAELNTLKSEVQELRQSEVSRAEVARLRKDNAEVYQLRDKVSQLQKDIAGGVQARSAPPSPTESNDQKTGSLTTGQLQQVIRENQQLRTEVQKFHVLRDQAFVNKCINNLRQLDGATDQWAIENKKTTGDVVVADNITPYIAKSQMLQCPSGGTYTIGPVGTMPTCSIPGHAIPQEFAPK